MSVSAARSAAQIIPANARLFSIGAYFSALHELKEHGSRGFPISAEHLGWTPPTEKYPFGLPIIDHIFGRRDAPYHRLWVDGVHPREPWSMIDSVYRARRRCMDPYAERGVTDHVVCLRPAAIDANYWIADAAGRGCRKPDFGQYVGGYVCEASPQLSVEYSYPDPDAPGRFPFEPSYGTKAVIALDEMIGAEDGRVVLVRMGHAWNGCGTHFCASGPKADALARELSALASTSTQALVLTPPELPRKLFDDAPAVFECATHDYITASTVGFKGGFTTRDYFSRHHEGVVILTTESATMTAGRSELMPRGLAHYDAEQLAIARLWALTRYAQWARAGVIKHVTDEDEVTMCARSTLGEGDQSPWGYIDAPNREDVVDLSEPEWNRDVPEGQEYLRVAAATIAKARQAALVGRAYAPLGREVADDLRRDASAVAFQAKRHAGLRLLDAAQPARTIYVAGELASAHALRQNDVLVA